MKKYAVLLAFLAVFAIGCGAEEDKSYDYSPPAWIHGEWKNSSAGMKYEFTEDDIIQTTSTLVSSFSDTYTKDNCEMSEERNSETIDGVIVDKYKIFIILNGVEYEYFFGKSRNADNLSFSLYVDGTKSGATVSLTKVAGMPAE